MGWLLQRARMAFELFREERFHTRASIFILLLMSVLSTELLWYSSIHHVDFYDELWGPSYLLVQGKSPYNTSSLDPMQPAGWLPMVIGFYFPLGWLSEVNATQVWLVLNIVAIIFCYFQWKYSSLPQSIYWSLALGLLISPYIGSWDFVALFPLIALIYSICDWKRKTLLILSYVVSWRLMAFVQAQHNGLNYYFWWIPLWFIMTALLVMNWKNDNVMAGTVKRVVQNREV